MTQTPQAYDTLSEDTLDPYTLIETFREALVTRYGVKNDATTDAAKWLNNVDEFAPIEDDDGSDDILTALIWELDAIAPPYCYFGAHEGDGASFGFWPCMVSVENDVRDGEILQLNDGDEIPTGETRPVLFVNDHGNVRLCVPKTEHIEAWSMV